MDCPSPFGARAFGTRHAPGSIPGRPVEEESMTETTEIEAPDWEEIAPGADICHPVEGWHGTRWYQVRVEAREDATYTARPVGVGEFLRALRAGGINLELLERQRQVSRHHPDRIFVEGCGFDANAYEDMARRCAAARLVSVSNTAEIAADGSATREHAGVAGALVGLDEDGKPAALLVSYGGWSPREAAE